MAQDTTQQIEKAACDAIASFREAQATTRVSVSSGRGERPPAEEESPLDSEASEPAPGSSRPLRPNQELVSRTDPEATLVDRPEFGRHLACKAHLAAAWGVRAGDHLCRGHDRRGSR
jgi:hypothetical protein